MVIEALTGLISEAKMMATLLKGPKHSVFLGLDDVLEAQAVVKRARTKGPATPSAPVYAPLVVRKKRKTTTMETVGSMAERDAGWQRKLSAMMATARVLR